MAYSGNTLPLTGAGDATAIVGADVIGGISYQAIKLLDGTEGSTIAVPAKATTPDSTDAGLVVRPIGTTAYTQAVVMSSQQTVTVGNPTTAVSLSSNPGLTSGSSAVELTSAGSTRLAGRFTVENPTTAVSLSSQHTVTVGNPTTAVSLSSNPGLTSGSSAVELTSAGSTRSVGTFNQGSPAGTSADAWWVRTVTTGSAGAGSTVVSLSSQITVTSSGTTVVDVSSGVILGAGSSANTLGNVAQGPGSSGNYWFSQPVPFTSGLTSRSSVATSVDVQIVAGTSARMAMIVANRSTLQTVGIGFSTGAVTTALANVDLFIPPSGYVTFGYSGGVPLYRGPLRAINLTSTAVAGSVSVTQFLSS